MTGPMTDSDELYLQNLLKSDEFNEVERGVKPRITAAIAARGKEGKTHKMLEAPDPIVVFNSDYSLEGVVEKFPDKIVIEYKVPIPDPDASDVDGGVKRIMTEHYNVFKKADKALDVVLRNPAVRTIAFDTATEFWEIVRLAYLGRLEKVIQRDFGPANSAMRRFLKKALDSDKNILFLQKMKQEWIGKESTGNYIMSGFGDVEYIAQVVMRPFYAREDLELPDGQVAPAGTHGVHIMDSRHNPKLNDTYYVGPMSHFKYIAAMLTGASPKEFE